RDAAARRPRTRRRGGAELGPRARRVRRHDHLRRELPRPHPDHAAGRLPRIGDRSGGRDRAQPDPARRLGRRPGVPARPLEGRRVRPVLDARIVAERGGFRLDLPLRVDAGETVALLGPNGAGKTTALRTLAGLHALSGGHVTLAGRDLDRPAGRGGAWVPPERRGIGVVFQDYLLFPHLTVLDNVAFGPRRHGAGRARARAGAAEHLARTGLEGSASPTP